MLQEAPHPSLTPYLGILYPRSDAKYVTEISNNKEIGSAFAAFLKNEFDRVELSFSPEVVDLQPFIWQGFAVELHYTYRLSLTNLRAFSTIWMRRAAAISLVPRSRGCKSRPARISREIVRLSEKSFERQSLVASHGQAVSQI